MRVVGEKSASRLKVLYFASWRPSGTDVPFGQNLAESPTMPWKSALQDTGASSYLSLFQK